MSYFNDKQTEGKLYNIARIKEYDEGYEEGRRRGYIEGMNEAVRLLANHIETGFASRPLLIKMTMEEAIGFHNAIKNDKEHSVIQQLKEI